MYLLFVFLVFMFLLGAYIYYLSFSEVNEMIKDISLELQELKNVKIGEDKFNKSGSI